MLELTSEQYVALESYGISISNIHDFLYMCNSKEKRKLVELISKKKYKAAADLLLSVLS